MPEPRLHAERMVLQALVSALLRGDAGFCAEIFARLRAVMFSAPEYSAAFETFRELQEKLLASGPRSLLSLPDLREGFLARMTRKGFPDVAFEDYLTVEPPPPGAADDANRPL
jgi:hypothetical protein